MAIQIGTAPDSWGVWFPDDPHQPPWHRFLDEVAEAGYEWIELGPYGYLPTDLSTLRSELDKRGLKMASSFVEGHLDEPAAWPDLERQLLGAGELTAALGGQVLALIDDAYADLVTGKLTGPKRLDPSGWGRLVDTTQRIAQIARDRFGLKLAFHPNAETHVEYEDQIETLLEETDPNLVSLCLDIGHHAYRRGDPIAFIRRHQQRLCHIHIKNVKGEILEQVEAEQTLMARAVGMGVFCEPGEGLVDYLAVRDVLREVGYNGFAIVEQDMYPAPLDKPLPIAKHTRAYLREIELG